MKMIGKYLNQQSGYSLAGLMASVAITAIVALGAAYVIISAQKTANFSDIQNEIDRAHYLNLQLSRNPAFILRQPGFEKGGALYSCLQHSPLAGVNCLRLQTPPSYVSETKITSLQQNLTSSIAFQAVCKMPTYCDSITMTTVTGFLQSSLRQNPNFQTRRSVSMMPGYVLVPRTGFNFNCVLSQGLITQLNFGSSQALCQPLSGTLSDPNAPLTNFGPVTPPSTQTMTNQDCGATGFSSIGSFQDQASCMVPVAVTATTTTTTTLVAGGPTTTTMPLTNWNCTDGYAGGAPCNTGINLVDSGYLSPNNPGSARIQLKTNNANGTPNTKCVCTSGAVKVVSCSQGNRYITCQGGANPLPSCPWPGPSMPPNCYPVAGGWFCPAFDNLVATSYTCP